MNANFLALGAIALWASLAALGVALSHVPPFLLTGLSLLVGSLIALPLSRFDVRQWRVPASTLALGVYGLFGFHFLLFIALRHAPPVQANLVNYLWPLGIVVMAPLFLPGVTLLAKPVFAALVGDAGTASVQVLDVVESSAPLRRMHEPDNPLADADGMVFYANVNEVAEMADMMAASRAFETNVEVMGRIKSMQQSLIRMGES